MKKKLWNDQTTLLNQRNICKLYFENVLKIILIGNRKELVSILFSD